MKKNTQGKIDADDKNSAGQYVYMPYMITNIINSNDFDASKPSRYKLKKVNMKIKIEAQIYDFNECILIGDIESIIVNLQKEADRLKDMGYENIRLEHYEDYWCSAFGTRLENDMEYSFRLKEEEKAAIKEKKKLYSERRQYEKLKNKFEGL